MAVFGDSPLPADVEPLPHPPALAQEDRLASGNRMDALNAADQDAERNALRLVERLQAYRRVAVALSGGVDSSVVAAAAQRALGSSAVALTAVSPSVSTEELNDARTLAAMIGIRHVCVETGEFRDPRYLANPSNRCYFCKSALYDRMLAAQDELQFDVIVNGTNADDLGDHRPGLTAMAERDVKAPLAELGLTKAAVRSIARFWGLPVADKPASPCLSSRIAYGVSVTPERVDRIHQAEQYLRGRMGLAELRVRLHEGELARIELPASAIALAAQPPLRDEIAARLRELGFRFITLDLLPFRSGSLNELVSLATLGSKPSSDVAARS